MVGGRSRTFENVTLPTLSKLLTTLCQFFYDYVRSFNECSSNVVLAHADFSMYLFVEIAIDRGTRAHLNMNNKYLRVEMSFPR